MTNIIDYLRELLGSTDSFWHNFEGSGTYNTYAWDYGYLFEYFVAGVILCVVIANVFKFLRALIS